MSEPGHEWSADDLATIERTDEIELATRSSDGTLRSARTVWIVVLDGAAYVRSVNGPDAAWYRGARSRDEGHISVGPLERDVRFVDVSGPDGDVDDDALDAVYRSKYRRWPEPVERITSPLARGTTLGVEPA